MTEPAATFIDRLMTQRYGIAYNAAGEPELKPHELWMYADKRKAILGELRHMPPLALACLMSETYATRIDSEKADPLYDPLAFAK
jgi:hypothetical protein